MSRPCFLCGSTVHDPCSNVEEAVHCSRFERACKRTVTVGELREVAESAAADWSSCNPRWNVPLDEFVGWHVRSATGQL